MIYEPVYSITNSSGDADDEDSLDETEIVERVIYHNVPDDSFKNMCGLLSELDVDKHFKFIKDAILSFSIRIHGFAYCPDDELPLYVYNGLKNLLGIKLSSVEICANISYGRDPSVIGVLLSRKKTKNEILDKAKARNLKYVKFRSNYDFQWILESLDMEVGKFA